MRMNRLLRAAAAVLLTLAVTAAQLAPVSAWDGAIDQTTDHASEAGMYRYTLELRVDDPWCSSSRDVEEFRFDFDYLSENGYGAKKTYRLDMSLDAGGKKNLNDDILQKHFRRTNENAYVTMMDVWIPGLVTEVRVRLNMDWEEMDVTVGGVWLGGYRVNTDTDYVLSRIAESNAKIPCHVPCALIVESPSEAAGAAALHDQYGGVLTEKNAADALAKAADGDYSGFRNYKGYSEKRE